MNTASTAHPALRPLDRAEIEAALPRRNLTRHRGIAVLLPCYNEATTVGEVIAGFRLALPGAAIYVYDNNSTDGTAAVAAAAGAVVRRETYQGKGHVVRRMFADVEADIYVLADGDLTYDASSAARLVDGLVTSGLDMVVATRKDAGGGFPKGHRLGNLMFNALVSRLFGPGLKDILSGYRVMSRRFVKSFPGTTGGFEIETELSIHALDLKLATLEMPAPYGVRPADSASKLKTFRDGFRILLSILLMYKALQPFRFFGVIALGFVLAAVGVAAPLLPTYLQTGLVPRFPTAILAGGLMQVAFLSLACGIIVEAVSGGRRELKRMRYLDLPGPADHRPPTSRPRSVG